ncbi:MAG: diphosphate--fructose-6-phosphate 1-phosphotransferase [Bacilli bacterium]|nr:diphosphate--fructose-6-phosphate 1-phosphotransferase [Bacilli bacterium]
MKNMVYIQSGGPTSVINTSFYGAVMEARKHRDQIDHIYGSLHGVEGLLADDLIDIDQEDEEQLELLLQTPGSILGTTRRKLPKDIHAEEYQKIIETLKKHSIKYVFINGGNDTMDTCYKLSLLVKEMGLDIVVVGVPKTIDNDLACTDHSLGFPSAAKFVINAVNAMAKDAQCFQVGKVHIFEIMGRNAGWLTAAPDVLPEDTRPDLFYIPENEFNVDEFLEDIKEVYARKGYALVAISEGIKIPRDTANMRVDGFGHVQLGGAAATLCQIIEDKLDIPTRAVEFSLVQRAFPAFISKVDREEALETGKKAVLTALEGKTGCMIIFKRTSSHPYKMQMELCDLANIANEEAKITPELMCDKTRFSDKFREYIRPLIEGEVTLKCENGVALVSHFKKVKVQ